MIKKEDGIDIHVGMGVRLHTCPECYSRTRKVHDYRIRKVGHLKLFEQMTSLVYNRRRYICRQCGKRFSENNPFVGRYQCFSNDWNKSVGLRSIKAKTFKVMAVSFGASATTITRRFDTLASTIMKGPVKLPKAIAIEMNYYWHSREYVLLLDCSLQFGSRARLDLAI